MEMNHDRLEKQLQFIIEIDKLKHILRQNSLMDSSRQENDAEHSWHLAVMAILLAEYAKGKGIDIFRVVKMVLIHDLVEIDAGDTYCYDDVSIQDQKERETKAAERIFNLLPADQAKEIRALWDEFEARSTPESRYANALDRLQPFLLNYHTDGHSWQDHGVKRGQVITRCQPIEDGAPALWDYVAVRIEDAVRTGVLSE